MHHTDSKGSGQTAQMQKANILEETIAQGSALVYSVKPKDTTKPTFRTGKQCRNIVKALHPCRPTFLSIKWG